MWQVTCTQVCSACAIWVNEINSAEAWVTRYPAGRVKEREGKGAAGNASWGGQAKRWPAVISTFPQRSSVSHGDSAWTSWLLCKLEFHALEKPVESLKGRLKIIAAISSMTKKEKFLAIRMEILILCYAYIRVLILVFAFLASELSIFLCY